MCAGTVSHSAPLHDTHRVVRFRGSVMCPLSRRALLSTVGTTAIASAFPQLSRATDLARSPFRIAVINDEISQDFDRACRVAAEFGMKWIELRGMWNKNILDLDSRETAESLRLLKKYDLRVTDIASPLFKVDWPGAPKSKFSPKQDQFNAHFGFEQQDEVLEKCIEMAKTFGTDRVRCFDFWRLDDPKPHRAEINEQLRKAADRVAQVGLLLVLENEAACNTGTGKEAAEVLMAVQHPAFMLNWDPGNGQLWARRHIPTATICCQKTELGTATARMPSRAEPSMTGRPLEKVLWTGSDSSKR